MDEEQVQSEFEMKLSSVMFQIIILFIKFQVLRRAFSMFDSSKTGKIEKEKVRTILNTLGHTYDDCELDALLTAEDTEGNRAKALPSYP